MPDLQYGMAAVDRDRGNFPDIPVINMFVEEVPTEAKPSLQSRPGLEDSSITMGGGPVTGLYHVDGVVSGGVFGVSGGNLYSSNTLVGAIGGTGPVSFGGYSDRLYINAGSAVYKYNGTALSTIALPDSILVTNICMAASRLIVVSKDTGRFYWSDPLVDTVDALSFATAEQSPDKVRQCLYVADTLLLFGAETVEFWPVNANPDLPFQPLVGRTYPVGIRATGCATIWNDTFAWITNRNQICVGEPNKVVSTSSIDEKLAKSLTARLWTFTLEGISFLALRTDTETWVMNPSSSQWSTFESFGQPNWIPQCFDFDYFGSGIDGRLVQWADIHTDFGGLLERRFRAGQPVDAGVLSLYSLRIRTNVGQTPYVTGDYADPSIELRTSRDGGYEWSPWKEANLGELGHYRTTVMFRSLGFFGHPSVLVEIRVTDPVPFRVSGIVINEPYGTV